MVFVENDSFRNLRRPPTDAFRSIPRLPRGDLVLPVAASDLVAWYPFRSGTGVDATAGDSNFGDTTDYSAVVSGPTYKPSGGVTDIQTGANSGAFDFDGTDDTLDLGTVADSNQSLTIMTWVKPDTVSRKFPQRVITKRDGASDANGSLILDLNDQTPRFTAANNGGFTAIPASSNISAGVYAHVGGRYDFSAGEITVFVNGQPSGTTSVGQLAALSSQPFRIGQGNPANSFAKFIDGTVDDTRIYQAALSDSQINQIYLNTEP